MKIYPKDYDEKTEQWLLTVDIEKIEKLYGCAAEFDTDSRGEPFIRLEGFDALGHVCGFCSIPHCLICGDYSEDDEEKKNE